VSKIASCRRIQRVAAPRATAGGPTDRARSVIPCRCSVTLSHEKAFRDGPRRNARFAARVQSTHGCSLPLTGGSAGASPEPSSSGIHSGEPLAPDGSVVCAAVDMEARPRRSGVDRRSQFIRPVFAFYVRRVDPQQRAVRPRPTRQGAESGRRRLTTAGAYVVRGCTTRRRTRRLHAPTGDRVPAPIHLDQHGVERHAAVVVLAFVAQTGLPPFSPTSNFGPLRPTTRSRVVGCYHLLRPSPASAGVNACEPWGAIRTVRHACAGAGKSFTTDPCRIPSDRRERCK